MGRIAPDGYDVFVMMLNQTSGTHTNAGTLGSAGNWTEYGSPISGVQGLFDDALYIPGTIISSNRDGAGGANDIEITPNISMSGWVYLRRYQAVNQEIFVKQYFLNGWSNPFLTFGLQMTTGNNGAWEFYLTLSGVLRVVTVSTTDGPIPVGRWCHLGATWDGTTLRAYLNGTNVQSTVPPVGTIDYGTIGSRGQWFVGGIPGTGTNQAAPCILQDVRIANIARPQSYFANIYVNGLTP